MNNMTTDNNEVVLYGTSFIKQDNDAILSDVQSDLSNPNIKKQTFFYVNADTRKVSLHAPDGSGEKFDETVLWGIKSLLPMLVVTSDEAKAEFSKWFNETDKEEEA